MSEFQPGDKVLHFCSFEVDGFLSVTLTERHPQYPEWWYFEEMPGQMVREDSLRRNDGERVGFG